MIFHISVVVSYHDSHIWSMKSLSSKSTITSSITTQFIRSTCGRERFGSNPFIPRTFFIKSTYKVYRKQIILAIFQIVLKLIKWRVRVQKKIVEKLMFNYANFTRHISYEKWTFKCLLIDCRIVLNFLKLSK